MLRFKILGSGSSGNATVVQARCASGASHLLVDCGLTLKQLDIRLAQAGLSADLLDAIFVTHEHSDHLGSAVALALRQNIPLWCSLGTHSAAAALELGDLWRCAHDGQPFEVGSLCVTPFTVPHDAREPLQLHCSANGFKLGILTDLGHATAHVVDLLQGCDALILECNHDAELLAASKYPAFLKQRVGGAYGHMSNVQSAQLIQALAHPNLRYVVAAHLSARNNQPAIARASLAQALGWPEERIAVAHAITGCDWVEMREAVRLTATL